MAHADSEVMQGEQGASKPGRESETPLLRTKLFIPSIRAKRVARPDIIERIISGLDKALILVSAPAGFGKTSALAEWAAQAKLPVAWLSLDGGDNDPYHFLAYTIAALNTAFGEIPVCHAARDMLQSIQPLPIQAILFTLINELTEVSQPVVLVLDDFQFITSQGVNDAVAAILERIPPNLHLVISTRVDPSLPLHRLRARQQMIEIRTDDLRFSAQETEAFLNRVMDLSLSDADISSLSARTEGWIVGLQMAALSLSGVHDRAAFIRAFGGSHRYILEYLLEEVLDRQPESLQAFLLQTAVLDRLCGPLCDAVLAAQGSPAILEHLERANLFLTPLDEVAYWYRYHHLFADLLRARLQRSHPERLPDLHLRASQWFEEAGLAQEAIQHAFAAKDLERAAWLVEQNALDIMSRGELSSLLQLFATLPEELVNRRPGLGIYRAWALTFSGQLEKVEPQLQEVEKHIQPGDATAAAKKISGSITVIRGLIADFQGDMPAALDYARRADELLPEGNLIERTIIPYLLGDGYSATGDLDNAEQAFEQIKKMGQASGNLWTVSVALHKLALLKKLQGRLHAVDRLYQEAITFAKERGGQRYGSMGASYIGLSDLLRERGELEAARQTVEQAIAIMQHWQNPTDLVNGYITLARISLAQGEIATAGIALQKAIETSRQGKIFQITMKTLEACQVRLWQAQGDLPQLDRWLNEKLPDGQKIATDRMIDLLRELEWITIARVLIASNKPDNALDLLTALAESAGPAGRYGRLIEIYILAALALHAIGKTTQAHTMLIKSLVLAQPEGYVRIFLDEGKPMEELLQACSQKVEAALKAYVDQLLAAFTRLPVAQAGISMPSTPGVPLVEALTGREVEVLHLLAAGLSNQEIAARLYLSEGTIKTHTHNLYGKLGVQSRTGAIARANELNIL